MRKFLSRRRFEVVALVVALPLAGLHVLADRPMAVVQGQVTIGATRLLQQLEGGAHDLKFRLRGPRAPDPAILVVEIDESAVNRYGLWPWPRRRLAEVIRRLKGLGAKVVALDVALVDQVQDPLGVAYRELLEKFEQEPAAPQMPEFRAELARRATTEGDRELAEALGAVQAVQAAFYDRALRAPVRPADAIERQLIRTARGPVAGAEYLLPLESLACPTAAGLTTSVPMLNQVPNRLGFVNIEPDPDGVSRRVPLLVCVREPAGIASSLALQAASAQLDSVIDVVVRPELDPNAIQEVRLSRESAVVRRIPYRPLTLIDFPGPPPVFSSVSVVDVLEGKVDAARVKGRLVFLGNTVRAHSPDERVTPVSELQPGVFIHAAVASNVLQGRFLSRPEWLVLLEALVLVALAVGLGAVVPRLGAFGLKAVVLLGAIAGWLIADYVLFLRGVSVATALPLFALTTNALALLFAAYLTVDREKGRLRRVFSRYLGEDVMAEVLRDPDRINQGEKREMTVLFSDIRGFTSLSERMAPEQLARFLKEYLNPMTEIVFSERGTLDKYIGDAVMAFWNAPLDQDDHALRACRVALRFLSALEVLRKQWRQEGLPEFDIGVGINTGSMVVGNMGSDVRVDYTVLGDAVNLASRLEGTNKEYETHIVISEFTYRQVRDQVVARRLGSVRVRGRQTPVEIYELRGLGQSAGVEAEQIHLFESAVDEFVAGRLEGAAKGFREVLVRWPGDGPTLRYLAELARAGKNLPQPDGEQTFGGGAK